MKSTCSVQLVRRMKLHECHVTMLLTIVTCRTQTIVQPRIRTQII